MGVDPSTYSAALSAACAAVRSQPKLSYWARTRTTDPEAQPVLAVFCSEPAVKAWLAGSSYRHWPGLLLDLLDKADEFVNHGGQAEHVAALYAAQLESGALDGAGPTRSAVHRAVFSL